MERKLNNWMKHPKNYRSKAWRQAILNRKYISRLKQHLGCWYNFTNPITDWQDLYNHKGTFGWKTSSTICSCALCRDEKYNRNKVKREFHNMTDF